MALNLCSYLHRASDGVTRFSRAGSSDSLWAKIVSPGETKMSQVAYDKFISLSIKEKIHRLTENYVFFSVAHYHQNVKISECFTMMLFKGDFFISVQT